MNPALLPMLTRPIPRTREPLPVVGLGTYQAFDTGQDPEALHRLGEVMQCLAGHGGSVVDSSPMYGSAESVAGDVAERLGLRPRLFLATKVWTTGREAGIAQMQSSLRRMRTERMDLMQIHNLVDWRTHLGTLRDWKAGGRVRYLGVTHYHEGAYGALEAVMRTGDWDFVQLNYSLAERGAEDRLLPLAADLGMAVIVNRPFAQGSLFSRVKGRPLPGWAGELGCEGWAGFFLKWILGHPAVTCVIPASGRPEHARSDMLAGSGTLPDTAQRQRMAAYLGAP